MAKYLCTERCFDSQKCRSYYEDEVYDLSASQVKHLKEIGHMKRFTPLEARVVSEPKDEDSDEGSEETKTKPAADKKDAGNKPGTKSAKAKAAG